MTRSSLLLLQRRYPEAFECHLGSASSEVTAPSLLAEPVWAGVVRWYLPFVILFFLIYFPLLVMMHTSIYAHLGCSVSMSRNCKATKLVQGLRYSLHSILDVPLPVGLVHTYLNSLENSMNTTVMKLSAQFMTARNMGLGYTTHT
jgi:hypothetical protein